MKCITVPLNDMHDLFEAPQSDPFSSTWLDRAGLEYIAQLLKTSRLPRELKVTLQLPATPAYSVTQVKEAVSRYAQTKIDEARREMLSLRWQAVKALQTGLLVLGLALFGAAGVEGLESLPETLRSLISESLVIAGWVSMWHPAELFLYAWWTPWRQIHIYQHIQQMDLEFAVAAPAIA
ncbi:MAG TPA: hypothetical protein VK003_15405 [Oceanobacillus sp.]|nr:hypothetical protein [Oceanobacillus sp.]